MATTRELVQRWLERRGYPPPAPWRPAKHPDTCFGGQVPSCLHPSHFVSEEEVSSLVALVEEASRDTLAEVAKLAYETLPRHPGDPREGPERVCRMCGYTYERDVPDCAGAKLRALWLK